MTKLVITKLQNLRFGFSLSRSNWAWLNVQPALRMSVNFLIQRQGISCCRVSVYGAVEAAASAPGTASWKRNPATRPQKSYNHSYPSQQRYPAVRNAYANGKKIDPGSGYRQTTHDQIFQENIRNSLESWKLWQTMNCSVEDIVRRRGLTEFEVYEQICECVQQGKEIDWFDLCDEAGFSPQIVCEINDAKEKAEEALKVPLEQRRDEFGRVPVQCGHHVTDIHILIYNTMMTCGITPHEVFLTSREERPSQVPEKVAAPKKLAPTISKATSGPKKAAAADSRPPNVKLPSSVKSPSPEEPDSNKTPKRLTQKHMLQWMKDRNGVTLMELVLEFRGYNECQLMRLILLLERKKSIQLSQGIFRVTSPDE
ncbi:hypothetical protein M758_3G002900 [Ceratodon purpureus]|nr:hypothetical protein M758_3G002900 [Ceratodon purpureus]